MIEQSFLQMRVIPNPVLIQSSRGSTKLNFDIWIQNQSNLELTLRAIEFYVYDENNSLILKRRLNENGLSPNIVILPQRKILAQSDFYIFNPFSPIDQLFSLGHLRCLLELITESNEKITSTTEIFPQTYQQQLKLFLPLQGRVFVSDGHDYYAHHRRIPLNHPLARWLGLTGSSGRYAWDFMLVDREGNTFRNNGKQNEDYLGFSVPIRAPAEGQIVAARNNVKDNLPWHYPLREEFEKDPLLFLGNHIIINHGNNEYSALIHCQENSVLVQAGKFVTQGEVIAKLGNSGDSYLPHLHYQLMDGVDFRTAEGLPACFLDWDIFMGSNKTMHISYGAPETGEIIIA